MGGSSAQMNNDTRAIYCWCGNVNMGCFLYFLYSCVVDKPNKKLPSLRFPEDKFEHLPNRMQKTLQQCFRYAKKVSVFLGILGF